LLILEPFHYQIIQTCHSISRSKCNLDDDLLCCFSSSLCLFALMIGIYVQGWKYVKLDSFLIHEPNCVPNLRFKLVVLYSFQMGLRSINFFSYMILVYIIAIKFNTQTRSDNCRFKSFL